MTSWLGFGRSAEAFDVCADYRRGYLPAWSAETDT
jgi:hypothetical protein